ncbi:MAG: phosphocholine cytidylyltransferase family protein [Alphaproteobacteria bacterium]|nr:phosphocholine cytidylyltransferase family protein [Alphaproteobacteria bacterium]
MRAVILAAGRGSRMGALTEAKPKCLTELAGRPLLAMQCAALAAAGVSEVGIVTGYRAELLALPGLSRFHNPRWETTNMVASLACAAAWLEAGPCLVSYADIFYAAETVRRLAVATAPIAVAYDPDWRRLWEGRFEDPLSDAETFRLQGDRIVDIGRRPRSIDDIEGQYMGLLRFTPAAWQAAQRHRATLDAPACDRLDMTSLLRALIHADTEIRAVPTVPGWGEIDSASDLAFYEAQLAAGRLSLPA